MMLLSFSMTLFAEAKSDVEFIFKADDGNYYLSEQSVLALANYIKQLEDLNANYGQQIENLKKQIENLSAQNELLKTENEKLKAEIESQKVQKVAWTVVAGIVIGGVLYLFLK